MADVDRPPPVVPEPVRTEMDRAVDRLRSLVGRTIDVIQIAGLRPDDAALLGSNISKLSPFVSTMLERSVVDELTGVEPDHGYTWARQDPGFPDAGVVDPDGLFTGDGIEVKCWYVLASEITGRFRESQRHLEGHDVRIALVPWVMSHIVFGSPVILDVAIIDAMSLAQARDAHYHDPPHYLVAKPEDTSDRGAQLQQTNVEGFVLQSMSDEVRTDAERFVARMGREPDPHHPDTSALVRYLMERARYRRDSNFSKIDRVRHPQVESFKTSIQGRAHAGLPLTAWRRILEGLGSTNYATRSQAQLAVERLYARGS